ncbi:IS3 family transposase, partial [Brevibacterium casei]|nr:IS3 family transposase [Brevibacterium casei]
MLGFSKQGFYQWCANPVSDRDFEDAHLINAAYDVHTDDPSVSGTGFIADELHAAGYGASERRVWRLCSQEQLFSRT